MLTETLLLLWNPGKRFRGPALLWLFLLGGIATAYFDFLTAPTLTLTVPLILVCADRERYGVESGWKTLFLCCVFWTLGYAGMWGSKWLISLVMTRGKFLQDLLTRINLRSSTDYGTRHFSRTGTLVKNVRELFLNKYRLLFCAAYLAAVPLVWYDRLRTITLRTLKQILPFALPVLCSVAWILFLCNHSYLHTYFTYRTLAPCVFAALTAITPSRRLLFEEWLAN